MASSKIILPALAAVFVAACGQAANGQNEASSDLRNDAVQQEFAAPSGTYQAEETHRYITFSYSHLGYSNPWLRWRNWDATLDWNAENPSESSVSVVINAASIDSGVDVFDGHLNGEKFFDTANHPEITFVSTSVQQTGETTGTIEGDLTIKGTTKPVTLYATFNKADIDQRKNVYRIGFAGKATVKRSDFGVDLLAPAVSDEVDVVIEAEFIKPIDADE